MPSLSASPRRAAGAMARAAAVAGAIGGAVLLTAAPASAHVSIQEGPQEADSYAVLTFGVPHGCDESPTTKVRIQLPESIPTATPTVNPGWDIELVKEALDPPVDLGEGRMISERITEIAYTAKSPLPIEFRDALQISVHIPADAAGTTLAFPVVQECVEGSTSWSMLPEEGQDAHELESPAPTVEVIAAAGEGHGSDASEDAGSEDAGSSETTAAEDTTEAAAADTGADDSGGSDGLAIAGLVAGILGIVVGGVALASTRSSAGK